MYFIFLFPCTRPFRARRATDFSLQVLSKATEYIRHLEKRNNRLAEENRNMQSRIAAFEKLFMAGAIGGIPSPLS